MVSEGIAPAHAVPEPRAKLRNLTIAPAGEQVDRRMEQEVGARLAKIFWVEHVTFLVDMA